ncbi:terminase family protein [Gordonia sp. w5E2]|nr:terminase family protein [Gordonia sp. UBA6683]
MAESEARYRIVCAGRQVGKSRLLAVLALHQAFTVPGSLTLLVSAGETASLRLLDECGTLATKAPILRGSVVDDHKTTLTLSNGSRIVSVPASERQIRGWAVDLLIIDEAGFVAEDIWRAAEPAVIARRGRVVLSSSPWGNPQHFFRRLWTLGRVPDTKVASWHWPSIVSPLISDEDLTDIEAREPSNYFAREYLAEWPDEAGAYFSTNEIESATADYELLAPERARGATAVAGVDWGYSLDANALVLLGAVDEEHLIGRRDDLPVFYVPWLEHHYRMPFTQFVERIVQVGRGYELVSVVSETNGVGQGPTQALYEKFLHEPLMPGVLPVTTTARRKMAGFSTIKLLLQQGRLVLPRHPELLKQLSYLSFETLDSGLTRISVPESQGHDDLVMALMQAASCLNTYYEPERPQYLIKSKRPEMLTTPGKTVIPRTPRPMTDPMPLSWGPMNAKAWNA